MIQEADIGVGISGVEGMQVRNTQTSFFLIKYESYERESQFYKPFFCLYMQAVMASDFSIAQFRFLERLLVVHGHWCYKRIAQMVTYFFNPVYIRLKIRHIFNKILFKKQICYFFYKNIAFGLTLFYFEAFTGFSGQSVYDDWYMLLFNVVLTSLPVIALGVFEQDVSSEICLQVTHQND